MLEENNLTYEEFIKIIETVGWKKTTKRQMEIALKNSLTVKYVIDGNTVGNFSVSSKLVFHLSIVFLERVSYR